MATQQVDQTREDNPVSSKEELFGKPIEEYLFDDVFAVNKKIIEDNKNSTLIRKSSETGFYTMVYNNNVKISQSQITIKDGKFMSGNESVDFEYYGINKILIPNEDKKSAKSYINLMPYSQGLYIEEPIGDVTNYIVFDFDYVLAYRYYSYLLNDLKKFICQIQGFKNEKQQQSIIDYYYKPEPTELDMIEKAQTLHKKILCFMKEKKIDKYSEDDKNDIIQLIFGGTNRYNTILSMLNQFSKKKDKIILFYDGQKDEITHLLLLLKLDKYFSFVYGNETLREDILKDIILCKKANIMYMDRKINFKKVYENGNLLSISIAGDMSIKGNIPSYDFQINNLNKIIFIHEFDKSHGITIKLIEFITLKILHDNLFSSGNTFLQIPDNTNFRSKYLKYKQKYLALKQK